MNRTLALFAILMLQACKHPLEIVGEGDIVDLNGTSYGCTLEQFQAADAACMTNDVQEDYIVNYQAVPREGWKFVGWSGFLCARESIAPNCAYNAPTAWIAAWDEGFSDVVIPATVAVFEKLDTDEDGVPDLDDAFPDDPQEWEDTDLDGVGDNADVFPRDPTETIDTDGDGVGDNADAFPSDPTESADVDCDGIGDASDPFVADYVTTIQGDRCASGIHLYVFADGYTAAEQTKLASDANDFLQFVLEDSGISPYVSHWHIHAVQTESAESGIDAKYGTDTVDSAFGAGFGCFDIQRLICADDDLVFDELLKITSDANAIPVLMINSDEYGGSGGVIPVYSSAAMEVALHEMGHSFANLGDAYVDESIAATYLPFWVEGANANLTQFTAPAEVPWSLWIDDHLNYPMNEGESGVGICEGGYYHSTGFYRPLYESRMGVNNADFGVVNSEAWILESYRRTGVVHSISPVATEIDVAVGEPVKLSIKLHYDNGLQDISWTVNNVTQTGAADSNSVNFSSNDPGAYLVEVSVSDDSGAIRQDPNNRTTYQGDWLVRVAAP
jgi:hypothetical protein